MQSHKIRFIIIAVLCFGMTVASVVTFLSRPSAVPDRLLESSGTVGSVHASHSKSRLQSVNFTVAPAGDEFKYSSILPGIDPLWNEIRAGAPVRVTFSEEDGEREVWGLRLGDRVFVTPDQALQARRENGKNGIIFGLLALVGAGYFLHLARKA
ncbi:hypothetical protein [Xanthomonas sp. CFBP 8445]|uniref:hypothetical protein n=1 Tax=Xanthomonas sp. CFBP 8445 TaxID=2971236 RepID=UPI0021E0601E|nr:hypothetical protein [Xanthomonas sp. CFBP 8445]UYC10427.1 hypothetical protein NUG21_11510 [Xanthomonas sp. CFBP 8445]